ncbi:hypothetical protein AC579_235 [Pseudocercospora musae]|uniref:Apple domain-containing protein n=1 Tax=Pseudocercospora musae TaxID=113226 RepID=A0A139H6Y6_9PEZI|nr:hypothetical protein AC579_235 [Pseudocercospora musae]
MLSYSLGALLLGSAVANPVPQGFDWAAIEALGPVPTASIPVVNAAAAETTVSVNTAAAAASVSAAVQAAPSDTSLKVRRDNGGCSVPPSSSDTPSAFTSNSEFSNAANGAPTPAGYQEIFQNQAGSAIGIYGYMGFSVLDSYSTSECSNRCDKITGCQSFNICNDPTDGCTNPPSTTVIKCVYYGGPITPGSQTNTGQWRRDFQVVIAGSNAYVNNSIATPAGYSTPTFLDKAAIQAPNDCNGNPTYMGVKIWTDGPFSVGNCAAACSSQSDYNRAHPAADGSFQTCQFINTYVLYNGTQAVGQYCSLYNETWPATFATNVGQWRGPDYFNIAYSYSASNSTGGDDEPSNCVNPSSP